MKRKNLCAAVLGLSLLAGCGPSDSTPSSTPSAAPSAATTTPAPSASTAPSTSASAASPNGEVSTENSTVRVAMLKGPTGLGAAKLITDNTAGSTENKYTFSVLADPTEAVAGLSRSEEPFDIAALPTNLASSLYHKTNGQIQLLALNTLGVLYILENGNSIQSIADLAGKTIYATGQGANPEFVLNKLLRENDLEPGTDVTIEWKPSDELTTLMASGEVDFCMLPVPAATSVLMQNQDVRKAVDLTEAWDASGAEGVLTMGCVVARTAFVQENPAAVETFLQEYGASISYMSDPANLDDAAARAETCEIVPKAAVAKNAIPDANLCFLTGDDMIAGIQGYYEVLYEADPASIGGSIPDGAFYYKPDSNSSNS